MRAALSVVILASLAACSMTDFRPGPRVPASTTATAAVAPPTPTVQLTAKERLVAAIEANNCVLTADNVADVLARATISQQELLTLAPQLEAEGRAEVSGSGSIRVLSGACI